MMSIIEEFVVKVRRYSNAWGKVWWLLNVLFRGFVVQSVGAASFADETFLCDTNQPGCTKVCHNRFMPMGPIRYWNMQLVFLFLPTIFFYTYAQRFTERARQLETAEKEHQELEVQEAKERETMSMMTGSSGVTHTSMALGKKSRRIKQLRKKLGSFKRKEKFDAIAGKTQTTVMGTRLKMVYIAHCVIKIIVEIVFLWGNYALQLQQSQNYGYGMSIWSRAWTVPEKYVCQTDEQHLSLLGADNFYGRMFFSNNGACGQNKYGITCWVGKPNEKTFFLRYMIALDYISITVCILEIMEMIWRSTKKHGRRKLEQRFAVEDNMSYRDSIDLPLPPAPSYQLSEKRSPRVSRHKSSPPAARNTGFVYKPSPLTKAELARNESKVKKYLRRHDTTNGYYTGAGKHSGAGSLGSGKHDTTHHSSPLHNPEDLHRIQHLKKQGGSDSDLSQRSGSQPNLDEIPEGDEHNFRY